MVDHLLGGTLWNLLVSTVEFVIFRTWRLLRMTNTARCFRALGCFTLHSKKLEVCRIYINFSEDWRAPRVRYGDLAGWNNSLNLWQTRFLKMLCEIYSSLLVNLWVLQPKDHRELQQYFWSIQQDPLTMSEFCQILNSVTGAIRARRCN